MAFDNLQTLDGRYIRADAPFHWGSKQHLIVLIGLLALLSLAARLIATLRKPALTAHPHRREAYFGRLDSVVFVIGALLMAMIEFSFLRTGPIAWAPVLASVAAGDFLSNRALTGRLLLSVAHWYRRPRRSRAPHSND
jgi:hypothetical protein